jgi:hypothetical protein
LAAATATKRQQGRRRLRWRRSRACIGTGCAPVGWAALLSFVLFDSPGRLGCTRLGSRVERERLAGLSDRLGERSFRGARRLRLGWLIVVTSVTLWLLARPVGMDRGRSSEAHSVVCGA